LIRSPDNPEARKAEKAAVEEIGNERQRSGKGANRAKGLPMPGKGRGTALTQGVEGNISPDSGGGSRCPRGKRPSQLQKTEREGGKHAPALGGVSQPAGGMRNLAGKKNRRVSRKKKKESSP